MISYVVFVSFSLCSEYQYTQNMLLIISLTYLISVKIMFLLRSTSSFKRKYSSEEKMGQWTPRGAAAVVIWMDYNYMDEEKTGTGTGRWFEPRSTPASLECPLRRDGVHACTGRLQSRCPVCPVGWIKK